MRRLYNSPKISFYFFWLKCYDSSFFFIDFSNKNIANNLSEELNDQFQIQDFYCKSKHVEMLIQLTKYTFLTFSKIETYKYLVSK